MKLLISVLIVSFGLAQVGNTIKPGHEFFMSERLGHFAEKPFIDLYKSYAKAFVLPKHPDRPNEDYRNYLPSGEECMDYLNEFTTRQYNLQELSEFVILDACLGYIYTSSRRELDSEESDSVRQNLSPLQEDKQLKSIYENAQIDNYSMAAKNCVANLFDQAIRTKKQFPKETCNNNWLLVVTNFAACQHHIIEDDTDSYRTLIYESVRAKGLVCFQEEIRSTNEAVRKHFNQHKTRNLMNMMSLRKVKRQRVERFWPEPIYDLFTAISAPTREISLHQVSNILTGISQSEPGFIYKFLSNLASYADRKIKADSSKAKQPPFDDKGSNRYKDMVDRLCLYFRDSTEVAHYNFAQAFRRMLEMLRYPQVFGIGIETFGRSIVYDHTFESAPVYLGVATCHILAHTRGVLEVTPHNGPLHYKIGLDASIKNAPLWPVATYY